MSTTVACQERKYRSVEELRLNRIRRHQKERRQRQARIRLSLALIAVVLGIISSCFIGGMISNASEADSTPTVKCYKSIVVSYGKDLDDIVADYMDYDHYKSTDELRGEITRTNRLTSTELEAGSYLVIPYFVEKSDL